MTRTTASELRATFDRSFAELPAGAPGEQLGLLLVLVGGEACALPLVQLAQILVGLRIAPIPSRERSLVGLATVRNVIVPIHDLAVALGHRDTPTPTRWAVVATGVPALAWSFDELHGQVRIERPVATATNPVSPVEISGRTRRVLDLEELRHAR